MGATTPVYALPYPTGTDLIMDGDNAIQALAERVEALLVPLGTLGFGQATAVQAGIGAAFVDITALSATVNIAAGHRLRVAVNIPSVYSSVAGDYPLLAIFEGATQLSSADIMLGAVGLGQTLRAEAIIAPTAGAHTYKAALQRVIGTGTLTVNASATNPAFLHVENLGLI